MLLDGLVAADVLRLLSWVSEPVGLSLAGLQDLSFQHQDRRSIPPQNLRTGLILSQSLRPAPHFGVNLHEETMRILAKRIEGHKLFRGAERRIQIPPLHM